MLQMTENLFENVYPQEFRISENLFISCPACPFKCCQKVLKYDLTGYLPVLISNPNTPRVIPIVFRLELVVVAWFTAESLYLTDPLWL